MPLERQTRDGRLFRAAQAFFFVELLLLPWLKHGLVIGGMMAAPTDLAFLFAASLFALAVLTGQARLRLHPGFALLALYFAALTVSAIFSTNPRASALRLMTELYLLLLPVLAYNLLRTETDLRSAFQWWVAAATAVGGYGAATLLLFPLLGPDSGLAEPLHNFGTLPNGPYPRLELTFEYPAMLANYLGTALMLLLLGRSHGWMAMPRPLHRAAGAAILVSAFFALTPGFGGIAAMLGFWAWFVERERRPAFACGAFLFACCCIFLEVAVSAITPLLHPSAPFLIEVPGVAVPLAPAVRLMAWVAAWHSFVASPLVGHGIGVEPFSVFFRKSLAEEGGYVTDAHNVFLDLAAHAGILAVVAILAIAAFVMRQLKRASPCDPLVFGLCLAWLAGFVIQGLIGAFEHARHLWVLLGFILAATSPDRANPTQTSACEVRLSGGGQ